MHDRYFYLPVLNAESYKIRHRVGNLRAAGKFSRPRAGQYVAGWEVKGQLTSCATREM